MGAAQESELDSGQSDRAPRSLEELPPLSEYESYFNSAPDGGPAVILFSSAYKSDSWTESRFTVVRRIKIFSEEGMGYGSVSFAVRSYENAEDIEGRTILPDGKVVELDVDSAVKLGASYRNIWGPELLYHFTLPELAPGVIIEYSYTISTLLGPGLRFNSWYLQDWIYTIDNRYTLDTPLEFMPINADLENVSSSAKPEQEIDNDRRIVTYRFSDLPALRYESQMPPPSYLMSRLVVDYEWTKSSTSEPIGFWMQAGRSEALKVNRELENSGSVPKLVAELLHGKKKPSERIEVINSWIKSNILNLASMPNELLLDEGELIYEENAGIADILERRYGTPMDITLLALAMMREAGLEAYLVLSVSRQVGVLRYSFLDSQQFDQAFVAVRLPGDEIAFSYPAAQNCPSNAVPWYVQGSLALICTPAGSMFARVPVDLPEANQANYHLELWLDTEGIAKGALESRYSGQEGMELENLLHYRSKPEREEFFRHDLTQRLPNVEFSGFELSGFEEKSDGLQVKINFSLQNYADKSSKGLEFRSHFKGILLNELSSEENRRQPVYLPYPYTINVTETVHLPEGFSVSIPGDKILESEVGEHRVGMKATRDGFVRERKLVLKRIFFDTSEFQLLRNFLQQVRNALSETIVASRRVLK